MEPSLLGLIGIVILLALLALRFPVAPATFVIAICGIGLTSASSGAGFFRWLAAIPRLLRDGLHPEAIGMLFLFVLLGNLAFYAGISTRVFDAARVWLRNQPGGLAIASVLGCGGFASLSGSSVSCASTMGRICLPGMLEQGYDPRLAASSVAVGGTLGSLIPPSMLFIFYGFLSGQSVATLFIAGILPGLLSLAGMIGVIVWWVREEPAAAPGPVRVSASGMQAMVALWPPIALLSIIIGGLFLGILSPLSAAAICVGLTFLIGLWQGRLPGDMLWIILRDSVLQAASLVLALAAAMLFLAFINDTGIAGIMAERLHSNGMSALSVIVIAAAILLVMGMFIEPLGILIISLPVLLPLMQVYGMDQIWFGVIVVKLLEIALITPPVGLNVFVISGVARNVTSEQIFGGVARFLLVDILVLTVLILFPAVSLLLPRMMAG
ncbi:TRAP transporter large permease [Paracoccus onubensis]|uniref:TRAP transporter large permease n=1 Tax=Paracoccus onubensis TaxID=1675788 RepID=A0A418SP42_9RHOB|nr:TRAP transporter large permease [Paracoccus onubensis]RJE82734.1 TRAP transporter large permease [Paracoccus onubensis]